MHRQGPRGPVFSGCIVLTRIPLPCRLLATILLTGAAGVHADEGMAPPRCPDVVLPATATPQAGTAQLGLLLNEAGDIEEARLLRSSGHAQLDEAARAALGACRFAPALQDGVPLQQWARTRYAWQLAPGS